MILLWTSYRYRWRAFISPASSREISSVLFSPSRRILEIWDLGFGDLEFGNLLFRA